MMTTGYSVKKRLIAVLLAVLMVLQVAPVSILAEDGGTVGGNLRGETAYTVTFVADGATVGTPLAVEEGSSVSESQAPAAPAKDGYIFKGWLYENGDDVSFPFTPESDVTLVANYIECYTVTF